MRATLFAILLVFARSSSADTHAKAREVQPTIDDMVRTLDVHSILNARDLGGLKGKSGYIPHGRFFRTATLARASDVDRTMLHARGVALDIDLRTWLESAHNEDLLDHDPRFTYRRISLLNAGVSDWFRGMHGLYLHTLDEHQSNFRDVFHTMAIWSGGAILYHCTSGKDRTGMVTAILLDLAGVSRDAIVRDYAISAHYLGRGASPPELITAFLDALHSKYGGAGAFLSHAGLPAAEIHALLVKLGQA